MGKPVAIDDFGQDFRSWQFQMGGVDGHDPSHFLVYRRSTGKIVSITRNYDPECVVDQFFPASESRVYYFPDKTKAPFPIRVRRLDGARLLLAIGVSKPGQATGQLMLIRESELKYFYGWLADALGSSVATQR